MEPILAQVPSGGYYGKGLSVRVHVHVHEVEASSTLVDSSSTLLPT